MRLGGENLSIRHYREQSKLLQVDLAKKLDVDQGTISNWERGVTKPYKKYIRKMTRIFGCTEDELMSDTPPKQVQ